MLKIKNIEPVGRAGKEAKPADTILLADGTYALRRMLDIAAPNVTVKGRSGDPAKVVLHGHGMAHDTVGVAFSISAAGVTVANVTVRDVGYHAVQVRGERG